MEEHKHSAEKIVTPGKETYWTGEGSVIEFDHIFPDFISAIEAYLIVDNGP